jgi:prolyl-tRNA synthetase
MKDAYSFHADQESLDETYGIMYETYCRIFARCGLDYAIVLAESGEMGGSGSHQFTIPCESGEDIIVQTEDGSYAANLEKAAVDPLPKQEPLKNPPPAEKVHTPNVGSIEAVCNFLKTRPEDMIKTLIYSADEEVIITLVRGDHDANLEKITQAVGGRHCELADEAVIVNLTGAAVGFAGPIGLFKKANHVIIDHAVAAMATGVTGANETDYHIKNVVPGRDFPLEGDNITITDIRNAVEGDTYNSKKLLFKRGIEVGQVFKLGKKYAQKLGAKFLDENGKEQICSMGCYGIGINRIIASAIEASNDNDGIIFPISIAPFEVIITPVGEQDKINSAAEKIHDQLENASIQCLLDDRDVRGGVKFKDADLLGIPVRITIGKKSMADGTVEIKLRNESKSTKVKIEEATQKTIELVNSLKEKLNAQR